jgi:hypothetical protein
VISNVAIYNFPPNKYFSAKRRIALSEVHQISTVLNSKVDFVIHVHGDWNYRSALLVEIRMR